jgi:hypothetical protein
MCGEYRIDFLDKKGHTKMVIVNSICLLPINLKKEKEKQHTDFLFVPKRQAVKMLFLDEEKKAEKTSRCSLDGSKKK